METLVNVYDVGEEGTINHNRCSYTYGVIKVQCFFIMDNGNQRKDVWTG